MKPKTFMLLLNMKLCFIILENLKTFFSSCTLLEMLFYFQATVCFFNVVTLKSSVSLLETGSRHVPNYIPLA